MFSQFLPKVPIDIFNRNRVEHTIVYTKIDHTYTYLYIVNNAKWVI